MYSVIVTDKIGTVLNGSVEIEEAPAIDIQLLGNPITCFGNNDGSVLAITFGGTGMHEYLWSNQETGPSISGLSAGEYSLTVTDENGCSESAKYDITEPEELNLTASHTNISCFGQNNGAISTEHTGGTGLNLSYLWNTGATTATLSDLPAGHYEVTATDGNGCTATIAADIEEPAMLEVEASSTFVSCNGGTDGSASATYSGGTGAVSFAWSNGETSATIDNLSTGTYGLTLTDANGCTASTSVNVTDPAMLSVSADIQEISCFGSTDGQAIATSSGGTGVISYLWSTGDTSAIASNLAPGEYSVSATDENGCETSTEVTLIEPNEVHLNPHIVDAVCHGDSNGIIDIIVVGAAGPYSYEWSNGNSVGSNNYNLPVGSYMVTVTYNQVCQVIDTFQVNEPEELIAETDPTSVSCFGGQDGSISSQFSGGSGQVEYLWNTDETSQGIDNLPAGEYSLTITDDHGCTDVSTAIVSQPDEPMLLIDQITAAIGSNADGAIEVSISGGTPGYIFQWFFDNNLISEEEDLFDIAAGIYTLIWTDANGCESTMDFEVESVTSAAERDLAKSISISPNPTSGAFTLMIDPSNVNASVSIFDVAGKQIIATRSISGRHDFDLSGQSAGVYLLRISVGEVEATKRIVISR